MKPKMDINALPEGCLAKAISLTNPRDTCRLALVNSTFLSAAQSETVWELFFPSDYLDIIAGSNANLEPVRSFTSKKELFLYLCDHHFLIDDAKKSIWLDKWSGKKCYMLAARDLHIAWGDTPGYWDWISLPGSRFPEVAKQLQVYGLEICGKIVTDMLSSNTTYVAYLVFSTTSKVTGFGYTLSQSSVGISGHCRTLFVCLDPIAAQELTREICLAPASMGQLELDIEERCPVQRGDCWMEVEMGEFHVSGTKVVEVVMSLKHVERGPTSGLIIQGIEIRPKRVK